MALGIISLFFLRFYSLTVVPFVSTSAKFGISAVMGLNHGTLECAHFRFKKCPMEQVLN
jgi:hypothetical protein